MRGSGVWCMLPAMTYPRAHLVDFEHGGFYLCTTRCVRRAWLCGEDPVTGQSFAHRKGWIEDLLLKLADIFAVELYGYAVMSNHYHVVWKMDPERVQGWSDEEVARRWLALSWATPKASDEARLAALLGNKDRLSKLRQRLGNLSWLMKSINEPVARRANREDGVTGRFWQGRFDSKALLDERAVIAGMAYVDLNPVRAKMATRIEATEHTSIRRRIDSPDGSPPPLPDLDAVGLTFTDYRALLEWTAAVECGGVDPPQPHVAQALGRLHQAPEAWLGCVKAYRFKYRAYGALRLLRRYAESLGQQWLRGAKPGFAAPP